MTERLLQFIWQFQYFNLSDLRLVTGESLQIIHPGIFNTDQGPDFLEAKIRIGETTWAGNIELHLDEEDWYKHAHQADPNYQNIILHVIWRKADKAVILPTLDLSDRVSKLLLHRYEELMFGQGFVACSHSLKEVPELTWLGWNESPMVHRINSDNANNHSP